MQAKLSIPRTVVHEMRDHKGSCAEGKLMAGWIEKASDGRDVLHEMQLVSPDDSTVSVPSSGIKWWLKNGAPGGPVVTGCVCGWVSAHAGPSLPPGDPVDVSAPDPNRMAVAWSADAVVPVLLPWHWVGDWKPGPAQSAWSEYHLRTWQSHVASVIPGTNADDAKVHALRRVAALLDDVDGLPLGVLSKLHEIGAAVESAQLLAARSARRAGFDWSSIGTSVGLDAEAAERLFGQD
ncbi:hypothetical protein [Streptomyces yaizuensis]|uniref:Uncharacterized protein n=1 Tax=Streptomyces yaizuensis TaxID=2989713 RepID=A0AA86M9I4_9ACTN|nr:hypothetical protein [Streptomyces sp. YSPA8]BDT39685.1 hypothetical protein SYYSPA8_37835 [Streptomyces sp. YSPA8]